VGFILRPKVLTLPAMLEIDKIDAIARSVATATLGSQRFSSIISAPTVDSLGRDALQITIVLMPGSEDNISGAAVLRTLVEINQKLQEAGEERFPIIRYRTDESLATNAAS
jgi:hypothetical protein